MGAPATLESQSPQSITFTSGPGYAAELQRLDPAPTGQRWVGWISPSLNYDTDANTVDGQLAFVGADWKLPFAADGSPFSAGTITSHWVVGMRNVTQVATPDRPVACGDSLTTTFKDVDDANQTSIGFVYCLDSAFDITSGASDLGVVTSGARASGAPGSLVTLPFILRSGGADGGTTPLPVEVSTTLAGATATLPQATIRQPRRNGDTAAAVAVGIPAGAAPGTYGVTFTVDIGGQTRTGVGSLTAPPPPPVTGTGGGAGGGEGGGGAGRGGDHRTKADDGAPQGPGGRGRTRGRAAGAAGIDRRRACPGPAAARPEEEADGLDRKADPAEVARTREGDLP